MLRFNSNHEYVARCLDDGFSLFESDTFRRIKSVTEIGAMALAILVGSSKLAVLVPAVTDTATASPRQLILYDIQQCQSMSDLVLDTQNGILNVETNEHRLVVVTETELHIFELPSMAPVQYVKTAPNPKGVVSLCPNVFATATVPSCCYVSFPTVLKSGDDCVVVHDVMDRSTTQVTVLLRPHKTSVTNLKFCADGQKLATASAKGTVIRIWSMPQGIPLHSLRRGNSTATIFTLSFGGTQNELLAVSSSSGTIHVFSCGEPYATTVAAFSAQKRSLWSVKVKDGSRFTGVALTRDGSKMHVVNAGWGFSYQVLEGIKGAKLIHESKLQ